MARQSLPGFKLPASGRGTATTLLTRLTLVALLAAIGFFAWKRVRSTAPPPALAPPPTAAPTAPTATSTALAHEDAKARTAQTLAGQGEGADEKLRAQFDGLSPRSEWQSWLSGTRGLIETTAVLLANLAEDEDPRRRMTPLLPAAAFAVVETSGHLVESPASAQRFDAAVDVIGSVDAGKCAQLWRAFHPLIDVAYRTVGRPQVPLDEALGEALERIETAPIADAPLPLEAAGHLWVYKDPALEQRGPVEKLMLRLGTDNERKLQAKARELQAALAIPWTAP